MAAKPRFLIRSSALALAAAALGALAVAAPVSATVKTFNFTGAAQTWVVPAGVTQATFDLFGARGGGRIDDPTFAPGLGGRATATIAVTPGDSIQVNVGGRGLGGPGGFNGGGHGGGIRGGDGGGGASDIRIGGTDLFDRVLVAGGGGGASAGTCFPDRPPVSGGDGGGENGDPGLSASCAAGAVVGGGATQTKPGTATAPATEGDFGVGGDGGVINFVGGGGGGGGWYGGGGGLGAAGGGGGSGHGPNGTVFETGVRQGNGLVKITYRTPRCDGQPATIIAVPGVPTTGTDGPDVILGTEGNDRIKALGGDDLICGRGRGDEIGAGAGADRILAGSGNDVVQGKADADTIDGGKGDDLLFGNKGDDSLDGGAGNNTLNGGGGVNTCVNGPVFIKCQGP
jgi:glycine rich protein/hemolysin type calcium-binding protein